MDVTKDVKKREPNVPLICHLCLLFIFVHFHFNNFIHLSFISFHSTNVSQSRTKYVSVLSRYVSSALIKFREIIKNLCYIITTSCILYFKQYLFLQCTQRSHTIQQNAYLDIGAHLQVSDKRNSGKFCVVQPP